MAVSQIKCPKCKTSMPYTAAACPNCKHRMVTVSKPKEPYKTPEERAKEWSLKWADGQPQPSNKGLIGALIAGGNLVIIIAICVSSSSKNDSSRSTSTSDSYSSSAQNLTNLSATPKPSSKAIELKGDETKSKYLSYEFYYTKEGEKTIAIFVPTFLPRDDKIVIGAIEDVVKKSYNDRGLTNPRLVPAENGTTNLLRMDSKSNAYVTLFVKEDTGEIHSLVITRSTL